MSLTRSEFLGQVLPSTGYICLVGLMADESKPPHQRFYPIEDAFNGALDEKITELLDEHREVYFACATFKDQRGQRTAKNSLGYKCFRADIDCGDGKPYPTQKAGLQALQKYLEETGLPLPMIVNSGRGWHVYWTLDEVINYNTWRPIADALKKSMAELEFITDPACTADGARILRIPQTLNTKDQANPKPVEILKAQPDVSLAEIRLPLKQYMADAIPEGMEIFQNAVATADDPLMRKMVQSSEKVFSRILSKSLNQVEIVETVEVVSEVNGERVTKQQKQKVMRSAGCAQIAELYKDQENTDYNVWFAGLSIARNCSDWETAIHTISSQDEGRYDYHRTIEKAEETVDKPHLCKTFQMYNPGPCLSCPLKGKITTPIVLGFTITKAEPLDNIHEQIWHQGLKEHTHVDIPLDYPKPWFRPKLGGVAILGLSNTDDDDNDEESTALIYENDIWVQKILNDPNHGAMLQIARILPKDGMKEFTIPLSYVYKKDKCSEIMGYHHIAVTPKHLPLMQRYLVDWTKMIQATREAEEAREQFGWHDNDTRFVIGSREIRDDGTVAYSPPCSVTEEIAPLYMPKGELSVWTQVINATYARPGNEERCFAFFGSFGAPLYKFFNANSMIEHLTNSASGVGKTTIQMAINSVWGHPKKTLMTENDTAMARQQRAGLLQHLPICFDEITNMKGEDASRFVFNFSEDRGRNRMQSQINAERKNSATWSTIGFTSGNNSMTDTIQNFRTSSQGEMYRIIDLEIHADRGLSKEESDHYFNHLLRDNYGHAGEVLMKYVVANRDLVVAEGLAEQKRFDADAGFSQQARNYSALCAATFTMARIAKRLGLHNIDVERVRDWAIKEFGSITNRVVSGSSLDSHNVLGDFFNQYNRNVLVINDKDHLSDDMMPTLPLREPYGELVIRYEPNTRKVYIARDKLRAWCTERRIPYTPMLQDMRASGIDNHSARICLSRGTAMPGSTVWTECFDADTLGWHVDSVDQAA